MAEAFSIVIFLQKSGDLISLNRHLISLYVFWYFLLFI